MPKLKRKKRIFTKPSYLSLILLLAFFAVVFQYYKDCKPNEPTQTPQNATEASATAPASASATASPSVSPSVSPSAPASPISRPPKPSKQPEAQTTVEEQNKLYNNLVYGGLPKTAVHLQILANTGYYSGFSETTKTPLWVAYRLDRHLITKRMARPSSFKPDMRTESKINHKLYSKSGYDKGHLAPNAAIAQRFGKEAQRETFLMSNIAPQTPALNRKVWSRLEKYEEECSDRFGPIWVIAGPIFGKDKKYIADTIEIPEAFYKIIIDEYKNSLRVLAFIVPQDVRGNEPINHFIVSVDEIEAKTGLDFLWPLSDGLENNLEAYAEHDIW